MTQAERTVELAKVALDLHKAAKGVLAAFDAGVFVRDTRGDGDTGWAIKALPHLCQLARMAEAVEKMEAVK